MKSDLIETHIQSEECDTRKVEGEFFLKKWAERDWKVPREKRKKERKDMFFRQHVGFRKHFHSTGALISTIKPVNHTHLPPPPKGVFTLCVFVCFTTNQYGNKILITYWLNWVHKSFFLHEQKLQSYISLFLHPSLTAPPRPPCPSMGEPVYILGVWIVNGSG